MITFTKSQREAIEHPGNLVITACPGSGKTTVISEKIRNEVDTLKRHRGVIAITFTRKASKELATRCKRGGKETKSSFFGTIDAFCITDIVLPFSQFIFGPGPKNLEPKFSDELTDEEKLIIKESEELLGEIELKNLNDYLPTLKKLYQRGCIFFPAIPLLANHIIENSNACRNYLKARYSAVYIDEYQDSSSSQHDLFLLLLALGIRGICVGDIQQSIYGWRKSSPEFLKQLIGRPDFHHVTVSINYRCHTSISNYASRIFSENSDVAPSEEIRVYQCLVEGDELDTASKLNKIIPSILKKFPIKKNSDIAILTRYNKGLQRIREKLTIPCKIYTEDELGKIESKTSQLWASLLEFRLNKTILTEDILNTYSSIADTNRNRLRSLRDAIKKTRTVSLEDLEDCLIGTSKLLLDTAATAFEIHALHQIIQDHEALNHYLPPTDDQVQCMTLHKSKGLEFDIVIHLDLVDWVFPKRIPGQNFNDAVYPELEQDLNLHYVGITRARRACVLIHTTQRINAQGVVKNADPSIFLSLPGLENLYKTVNS
ncbi:UvrD-helicase domain-containing protein [Pseudomonas prosekii]|uniref:UvrD-helicase domain-containing protein n=1 Tax=Pseudomonas prosekii TaxID=1148509 RepID=UPI003F757116